MELLRKHTKIAIDMYSKGLELDFIKEFAIEDIEKCCNEIERLGIEKNIYECDEVIQRELMQDTDTIEYLIKLKATGINFGKIKNLIKIIQQNGEKLIDYDIEKIIKVLQEIDEYRTIQYAYLKYFIDKIKTDLGKNVVIKNLRNFFMREELDLQDLNIEEIKLFTSPIFLSNNLIPRHNLKRVYELLVQNHELKRFILFLYLNKLELPLNIEHYEKINEATKEIHESIKKISKMINNENLYRLLLRWMNNECALYDLKIIESKIGNVNKTELENIVSSRSEYINFIFGNKISRMKLEQIETNKEELIINAIRNNKKRFLNLIEEHQEEFLSIPYSSILYEKEFYMEYFNINSLNIKNLKDLQFMNKRNYIETLQKGNYTFNEIKTLYDSRSENYYKLYNYLLDLKIDERLLRIKQIINKGKLDINIADDEIEKLAQKIKVKSLYNWLEQDFYRIQDIKPNDAIRLLINYDDISKFIGEMKNKKELMYVLRNKERIREYKNLQEIKDNIETIDEYWNELVQLMDFSQEFIEKNRSNINEFLLENGAELAIKYYRGRESKHAKQSYKLIIKAELMGEFRKLKYHTDDLQKELNFALDEYQIKEWMSNTSMKDNEIEIGEYDDFYSTMVLGEEPMSTCLSYEHGMYNRCLLACFDSNKKILYAKVDGKIVARAMVRLTKGTYQNTNVMQSLSFVDVENDNVSIKADTNEMLTVFLERPYISGISEELSCKVKSMFINLLEDKAKKMGALLVLSNAYKEYKKEKYIYTRYYMYISKSKAGTQYLDSLDGQATVSDEGQYKSNNFLIWLQSRSSERYRNKGHRCSLKFGER